MSYEVQVRRAAELDIAEAQVWYETQQTGLGAEFRSEVSRVIDRLAATPLVIRFCIATSAEQSFADSLIWFGIVSQPRR